MRTPPLSRRSAVAGVPLLTAWALAFVAGCGGSVPPPKEFAEYVDTGGKFACEYPKGWEKEGSGKPDSPSSYARFTAGSAKIEVNTDFAGSLFGDIARSQGNAFGAEAEPPVAKVHPMGARHMKEEYGDSYTEREPKPVQSKGLGEGRRSTFIANNTMGGKTYGYRATFLGGDRRVTVVCTSPATNWAALKPAFERVINSLRQ